MLNRRALAAFDTTCSIVRIFAAGRKASSAFNSLRTAEASASGFPSVCNTTVIGGQGSCACAR